MGFTKLQITAHPAETGEEATPIWTAEIGSYTVKINPEKFAINRKIKLDSSNGGDTAGAISKFTGYDPDSLSIDIMLDATGVIPEIKDVESEVESIGKVVYDYNGDFHRAPYLTVKWDKLVFKCTLESFNTEYTLFKPNGAPLRAKVSLAFKGYKDAKKEAKKVKKSSPDLTHVKTVRVGDSLPLMCKNVYGDIGYYSLVAQANGLVNFRDLEVGSKLYFPPLER